MKVWVFWLLVLVILCGGPSVWGQSVSVDLAWDANSEPDLTGYNLYRSLQSGSGFVKLNATLIPSTNYTDSTLVPGQTYFFVVRAVNTSGLESANSNEVQFATPAAPNQPPTANNDSITMSEDQSVQINVVFNDSDPEGDSLVVTSVTQGVNGSVAIVASNLVRYTPNPNFHGNDSFNYTISDGNGNSGTASVFVTVASVNDPPAAVSDSVTTQSGAVTINVTANDSDFDGDPLTVTQVTQPSNGTAAIESASSVLYTPNPGFSGSDSFSYTISDGNGATASATVSVTVQQSNQIPQTTDDSATTAEDQSVTIDVIANDSDPDGDSLSVSQVTQPGNGTASIAGSGSVLYTPAADFHGSDSFSYTVSDGKGGTATATVTITVNPVNDSPAATADSVSTPQDQAVTISVLANDSDVDGDTLIVSQVTQPADGSAVIQNGTSVRYTPDTGFFGSDSFSYTVSDGNGGTAGATVSVTVQKINQPPLAADDSVTTAEDQSVTFNVLSNDSDPNGDPLSVTQITQPANGSTTLLSDGSIRYTPTPDFNGTDSFSYTVSDGDGGTATATVTITVTPVNDSPVATADSVSTPQDQAVTVSVLANDSDVDGDTLTVSQVTQPANGSAVIQNGTAVRYTPNPGFFGSDSFSYTVSDGNGGTAGATVSVTVQKINQPPLAADDSVTTAEDQSVTFNVLSNDSDPNGDPLSVTQITQPANGSATLLSDGSIRYTPNPDFNGTDSFSYTVSDGDGGTATAPVTITVNPVNDNPVATADSVSTPQDQAVTVSVLANDSDVDGDTLTVSQVTQPADGTAVIQNGTSVRYTPDTGFFGSDSFSYTVSDGNGGTATAGVSIFVVQVGNQPPVAVDDAATTVEDQPVTIQVVSNDSDPDGDLLTVVQVSTPTNGSASITAANDSIQYTPDNGFSGSDSFSYTITDGRGGSAVAQVQVTVAPGNRAPTAVNDAITLSEDEPVDIAVLENDSDPDGDPLTIISMTQPANGVATLLGAVTIRYNPASDFSGNDSFSYTISDPQGETADATVSLVILPVNDPPVAVDDNAVTVVGEAVSIEVVANDFDVDSDILTVSSVSSPANGTASITDSGTVQYAPNQDFQGLDTFVYTISDTQGASATATVTVNVLEQNSTGERLILPATLNTGNPFFDDTFIGVAILNPEETPNTVTLDSISAQGEYLSSVQLAQVAPRGQVTFLSTEPFGPSPLMSALSAEGNSGPIQGFFLVGNSQTSRLDGVGADPVRAKRLIFPMARQHDQQSTLLFLHNPSDKPAFGISLKLFDAKSRLIEEQTVALAAGGSLTGNLSEIFDNNETLEEGFVQVDSDSELQGFEIVAEGDNYSSLSAQPETQSSRLLAPHFFVNANGSDTSVLRLLNREARAIEVKLRAFNDSSQLLAEESLRLPAGEMLVRDLHDLLQPVLAEMSANAGLSGFLELKLSQPLSFLSPTVTGSLTFSTNGQHSITTLPLIGAGTMDAIFPHVAQNQEARLFTGLSILNPGQETTQVLLTVFDAQGRRSGERSFELAPNSRRIDLLNGPTLLGSSFEQMNGHLQIQSTQPVITFAIFGDFRGEFLAAIEGQASR